MEDNFYPGACKVNPLLRNEGYNNNSTENQNLFKPTARDLLGISSVDIKFSTESFPQFYRRKNRTQQFKIVANSCN